MYKCINDYKYIYIYICINVYMYICIYVLTYDACGIVFLCALPRLPGYLEPMAPQKISPGFPHETCAVRRKDWRAASRRGFPFSSCPSSWTLNWFMVNISMGHLGYGLWLTWFIVHKYMNHKPANNCNKYGLWLIYLYLSGLSPLSSQHDKIRMW